MPDSTTSGLEPSRPTTAESRSIPAAVPSSVARISRSSTTLCSLRVARTSRGRHRGYPAGGAASASACSRGEVGAPGGGQLEQGVELAPVERRALGGALHLDEQAAAGGDHVHVGLGADVLLVVEVENRCAVGDPDAHGRHRVDQRVALDDTLRLRPRDGVGHRHVGAGDRGGAGAAVGLQHVAVEHQGVLPQLLGVDHGAQRAADQPRDLVGAAADAALDGLAVRAGVGGARQHRVLGGDPPAALALEPARHALGERGRAEHPGAAELHQDAPLGVVEPAAGDADVAELVGGAAVRARGHAVTLATRVRARSAGPARPAPAGRPRPRAPGPGRPRGRSTAAGG